jgi:hypothetical protein
MKERLDFGTFKKTLMKKYGKNQEPFVQYFTTKRKG